MGIWSQIRTNFLQALAEQRVEKWLIEESRNSGELATKYRQLNDVVAFVKFLDEQVKTEESTASGNNGGGIFVSFCAGRDV